MQTKNNFESRTRFIFFEDNYWTCWSCGSNQADCGHHIFGRGAEEGVEKSPLNFAPLCNHRCHLARHGYWMTDAGRRILLQKTYDHLKNSGYKLTELDVGFLRKYLSEYIRLKIEL